MATFSIILLIGSLLCLVAWRNQPVIITYCDQHQKLPRFEGQINYVSVVNVKTGEEMMGFTDLTATKEE